jgi:hypothetical protein
VLTFENRCPKGRELAESKGLKLKNKLLERQYELIPVMEMDEDE